MTNGGKNYSVILFRLENLDSLCYQRIKKEKKKTNYNNQFNQFPGEMMGEIDKLQHSKKVQINSF